MNKSRIAALIAAGSLSVFAAGCSGTTNDNANMAKPASSPATTTTTTTTATPTTSPAKAMASPAKAAATPKK